MDNVLLEGRHISIRRILPEDLAQISQHEYSVSIVEPLGEIADLQDELTRSGFWGRETGAVSIIENKSRRLVGTCQFFRSGPCIHGLEIGYIVHSESDRGKGVASEALGLISNYLFEAHADLHRLQLTIEVSNLASCRVAEKCGFEREGILRKSGFPPEYPNCYVYSLIREDVDEASS